MYQRLLIYTILYAITIFIVWSLFFLEPIQTDKYGLLKLIILIFVSTLFIKYGKSFLFMLVAPWYQVQKALREKRYPSANYNPLVSVLIPAYNEEVGLLATVKSLLASTYTNLEVIVINDGSTDGSDRIMRDFSKAYEMTLTASDTEDSKNLKKPILRYFYKENAGKGNALNFGLDQVRGDIIITIDADCALLPTTIGNFVKPFADPSVDAAVGNVEIGNSESMIGKIQFLEFLFTFYWKKAESVMGIIYIVGGAAGAFRREVFEKLGRFDHSTITEDIEISVRAQDAGMKIVFADDAFVYTEGAETFEGLAKQRLRWKRGWFQTFAKHPQMFFSLRKRHNKFLSWFILPLTGVANIQLFFEIWCVIGLYIYSYLINDYSAFISWIILETLPFFIQTEFEGKRLYRKEFLFIAPVSWLIFHLSAYIEYRSFILSLWSMIWRKEVVWQKWERKGCLNGQTTS